MSRCVNGRKCSSISVFVQRLFFFVTIASPVVTLDESMSNEDFLAWLESVKAFGKFRLDQQPCIGRALRPLPGRFGTLLQCGVYPADGDNRVIRGGIRTGLDSALLAETPSPSL